MSYEIKFEGNALHQLHSFTDSPGWEPFIERILRLVDAPWDATLAAPGDDQAFREITFGAGHGLISFHVDDNAEVIWIYNIVWLGPA